ncbi:VWA domain-containing protein [Pontibacillus salipaludis]|uniref:VWFA domain-containing protein n=1 Tax=Pontibacillus salipaludis TaxID=1697394 RepID=A0ABQ1Q9N9_9BACI|nr:VWA domain-containing protein [Pontibacillus salipaludis]GGD20258.1 hypothetical protein GCM10011389_29870 [Pontibacillus salipaludis]
MRKNVVVLVSIIAFLLAACSNNEQQSQNNQGQPEGNEEQKITTNNSNADEDNDEKVNKTSSGTSALADVPKLPATTSDLIHQEPGKYADQEPYADGVEEKVIEDLSKLDPLPQDADEKTKKLYFRYMYSLIAQDFEDPQNLINKWEYSASGNPDLPDSKYQFKDNYNVEVILDASGSMAAKVNGKTRMELAKQSIQNFLSDLPEEANISLRVYGHKGSGSDSDKELSCNSIEQVYSFDQYSKEKFSEALNQFEPKGWTPIADALKASQQSMSQFDPSASTNLIYLVSDGIETCDGNPAKIAKNFSESTTQPIINIIGFQADPKAQKQLKKVAQASNGMYSTVNNQKALEEEFDRAEEVLEAWEDWKEDAMSEAEYAETDNYFDILGFTNDWYYKHLDQSNKITAVMNLAEDAEILTYDQISEMEKWDSQISDLAEKSSKEIENQLENISAKKLDRFKKSIKEKFSEKTDK